MKNSKVVVITGPTGVGKTELSLKLCKLFNGEIINADASQFKKDLNIGTAKIDLKNTSIKHHLVDIIDCDQFYSISDFQNEGRKIIKDIHLRNKIPFLVGGSGLYINSLLFDYNLDSPKHSTNDENYYEQYSNEQLHDILKEVDYDASLKIHLNNRRRVIRAIELAKSGNKISENNYGNMSLYDHLIICLNTDREVLYNRINTRVIQMLNHGWLEECKKIMNSTYDISRIKDIGYQEIFSFLRNEITKNEMIEIISKKTRNYAKRQLTWMRNKMNCIFIDIDYENIDNTLEQISSIIRKYLDR